MLVAAGLLLTAGALLRLVALDRIPLGVQQDELSNIYDGYSILKTGADRFGDRFPVIVRGFGENDYRPALYPWLTVLPQAVTGFSVAAGRLPSAIMGIASLVLIFLLGRRMLGDQFALAALLFATFSPIHLVYSRLAHEGAILPAFFMILVLFLWDRAAAEGYTARRMLVLGFVTGLSANAYQASKLTAFLLAVFILLDVAIRSDNRLRNLAAFVVAALAGALPQIIALVEQTDRFFARARVLSISAANPFAYVSELLGNYWIHLAPGYLFAPGSIFDLSVARLLSVELPFFYLGVLGLWRLRGERQTRTTWHIYVASAIAILPGAITVGSPNALRASGFIVLSPFFSAGGLLLIASWIRTERLRRQVYVPLAVGLVLVNAAVLVHWYATSWVYKEAFYQKVVVDAAKKVGEYKSSFDQVIIERYGTQEYIYYVSFAPIAPRDFQRGPRSHYSTGMDEFTAIGPLRFVEPDRVPAALARADSARTRYLLVSPRKVPSMRVVDSADYGGRDKLYLETPIRRYQ